MKAGTGSHPQPYVSPEPCTVPAQNKYYRFYGKDVALPPGTQSHPHVVISQASFCLVLSSDLAREARC